MVLGRVTFRRITFMPKHFEPENLDYIEWLSAVAKRGKREADFVRNQPNVGPWVPTTLLNSCVAPPPPKIKIQYRLNPKEDKLQFRGHVDVNAATSPVHAFTLLQPFWLDYDDSWLTDVWDSSAFAVARAEFDSTNGHVTLTWPAS